MFLYDAIDILPVKYNPSVRELLASILPTIPSLKELSGNASENVIKICETSKFQCLSRYDVHKIVVSTRHTCVTLANNT